MNQAVVDMVEAAAKEAERCEDLTCAALLYGVAGALNEGDGAAEAMLEYLLPFRRESILRLRLKLRQANAQFS